MNSKVFTDLSELAQDLRAQLQTKKFVLLYAYNGTGKTRLSTEFKNLGKQTRSVHSGMGDGMGQPLTQEEVIGDTLYFNAFTEDLFSWDNDLDNDNVRRLQLNKNSRFFAGLSELEMDNRIRPLLHRYVDFDFRINTDDWFVSFSRRLEIEGRTIQVDDIKVSRGEENIFIWSFFLAIVELAMDSEIETYKWVKYVYIDDPISSLDENNAIAVANHLTQMLRRDGHVLKSVISTHHTLFFNVLCNEFKSKAHKLFLKATGTPNSYSLVDTTAKPFLHHLAALVDLYEAQSSGELYTHHFNMMRRVMEQASNFLGFEDWTTCIKVADDDPNKTLYKRIIDLMSHGDYSIYEPREMMEENKSHFRTIFQQFISAHPFNPELFPITPVPIL